MTPLPPKRRKLGHIRHDLSLAGANDLENNESDEQENQSSDDVPDTRTVQPKARQKRAQEADEAALYAGGTYKSSLFKLQVDELLSEVRPNYEKRLSVVNDVLRQLKGQIESIQSKDALPVLEATKSLHKSHKITVPFPNPHPDKHAAYKLAYARPSNINVVGSYVLKTMAKAESALSVDMVVVMPGNLFQEKDYLNYRYFYKRAYYLACIAAGLQDVTPNDFSLRFEYLHGNDLHPILVLRPKSDEMKVGSNFEIHVIPAAPESLFADKKLRPNKNAIRPKDGSEGIIKAASPTPFYNASLRSDCNFESYLKLLHSASKISDGFKDACILGRIWLRQRGFGSRISEGGFGPFEWAGLTALLLKQGGPNGHSLLSPGYNSYQMFKAVVQFLAVNDLASKPHIYDASDFAASKSNMPMLYDGPREQNLLYKMTPWSYMRLQVDAKATLDMLNDSSLDHFESTFIIRTSQTLYAYDCVVRVSYPTQTLHTTSCDHIPEPRKFSDRVFEIYREGLTDRVKLIHIEEPEIPSWSVKSAGPSLPQASLLVSVTFDPTNLERLVDHGPAAEEKKTASKYRMFWGEKAELRRFKDGRIVESLVWSPGSAYNILQEILTYLTKRHFGAEIASSLKFTGEGFEKLLFRSTTAARHFDSLKQAFDVLEKQLRDLEGLPLQLKQLSPIGPQLRYSSVEAPSFDHARPLQIPIDVQIQFEGSGRWPDDVVAIQRTKVALLLKIGSLLRGIDDSITTRLGLENEDARLENCAFLDVFYESGATFRLRVHSDREQTLLERQIKEKSTDPRIREDSMAALSIYKKNFLQLPLHTQSIAMHCTRFPVLSPTIRLVKKWFDCHMLLGHIGHELIELLVVHIFLKPYPWRVPSSTMTGFLRTLLFIARWDWRTVPLIVDFGGVMTSKEVDSINTRLEAWRKIDPGLNRTIIFAASNHDMTGTAFTNSGPSKLVAARMTALARSACKMVKEKELQLDPRSLFATSTTDYDFVIHLSPNFTREVSRKETIRPKFKNLEVQKETSLELVGNQPISQFLGELQTLYANSVVFFDGSSHGSIIAGLWIPQVPAKRPFKVGLGYASKPAGDENDAPEEIEVDRSSILAEIARLGGDIVSLIESH